MALLQKQAPPRTSAASRKRRVRTSAALEDQDTFGDSPQDTIEQQIAKLLADQAAKEEQKAEQRQRHIRQKYEQEVKQAEADFKAELEQQQGKQPHTANNLSSRA